MQNPPETLPVQNSPETVLGKRERDPDEQYFDQMISDEEWGVYAPNLKRRNVENQSEELGKAILDVIGRDFNVQDKADEGFKQKISEILHTYYPNHPEVLSGFQGGKKAALRIVGDIYNIPSFSAMHDEPEKMISIKETHQNQPIDTLSPHPKKEETSLGEGNFQESTQGNHGSATLLDRLSDAIPQDADLTLANLNRAFIKVKAQLRSEKKSDDPEFQDQLKELNEAYDRLKNKL